MRVTQTLDEELAYRVELEQFSGPLDLLLHLLKEEELDAESVPVARVCNRYLEELEGLNRIDIDAAGDFLVMASILIKLKARALLPRDEVALDDDDLDPRFELVRQLIEYRRYKQVAQLLAERRTEAARWFGRGMRPELEEARRIEYSAEALEGSSIHILFEAFAKLLEETESRAGYVLTRDDTPMEVHLERLEDLLVAGAELSFVQLFAGRETRGYIIGVFLALLELMKRGRVDVFQREAFDDIVVAGREPTPEAPVAPPPVHPERRAEAAS